jgi:hypothetical protein
MREPGDRVRDTDAISGGDVEGVTAIVIHRRADIKGVCTMRGKGSTDRGIVEDDSTSARRGHRGAIEIIGAMHLLISGDTGVDIGAAEHVEGHLSLLKEVGDSASGEFRVTRMDHGDQVVLHGAHFTLSTVVPMITRRHKTRDNIQTTHGVCKVSREDIVKHLELGFEPFGGKELDGGEVGVFVGLGGFGRHRLDFNKIGIRVIQKKKIFDPKVLPVIGVKVGKRCDGTTHISEHGVGCHVDSFGR